MKDTTYMNIANTIAENESKCVSRKVGAVIVKNDRIIGHGYNGTPSGFPNCTDINSDLINNSECGNFKNNDCALEHHKWSYQNELHAEMNALFYTNSLDITGGTLYCTTQPCHTCTLAIIASGIKRVVYRDQYEHADEEMLLKAGIEVLHLQKNPE